MFPKKHIKEKQPTLFIENIIKGIKIHTIRRNFDLWRKRMDDVNAGIAELSLRFWTGIPYKSKQKEFLRLNKHSGCGYQQLDFDAALGIFIDSYDSYVSIKEIAKNDGLSFDDFKSWFKNYNLSETMCIIHFTNFRYE